MVTLLYARDINLPVPVLIFKTSPVSMYSGTCTSRPVDSVAGLVRLVALADLIPGAVFTTSRLI